MFRSLVGMALGYFIYTKNGRHIAKNVCLNLLPYVEKECGFEIIKPIQELTKDREVKDDCNRS